MGSFLEPDRRHELLMRHRTERDGRIKDRIKAVLLRDDGYSVEQIAAVLFLSDEAIRQHIDDYMRKAKLKPENGGSKPQLNTAQTLKLLAHLDKQVYVDVKDICDYARAHFNVLYSRSGMTQFLKRSGFSYHKPAPVPAKADPARQEAFVAFYERLKNTLPDNETIVFMDGVHPTHQTRMAYGWIRKGLRKELPTTSGQKSMNIIGALNLETMHLMHKEYDTINGEAIVCFLKNLEVLMPTASAIHVVLDCARYHTCPAVMDFVKTSRIKLHYLPPYSPNLNVIERCWKIMHENVTNNRYYPNFNAFVKAVLGFFNLTFPQKAQSWVDRISDNFRIVNAPTLQM